MTIFFCSFNITREMIGSSYNSPTPLFHLLLWQWQYVIFVFIVGISFNEKSLLGHLAIGRWCSWLQLWTKRRAEGCYWALPPQRCAVGENLRSTGGIWCIDRTIALCSSISLKTTLYYLLILYIFAQIFVTVCGVVYKL